MMGALLLITCANVGNILLSRTLSRRGEFSIRIAIGAGRLRVARQLMVESFALAGLAAVLGIFVAWAGIIVLEQFYLSQLPRINVIGLDWGVLGIACLVSALVGVWCGTAPACLAGRINVNPSLKDSSQQYSGGVLQRLFHDGLVVVQLCLAVALLSGAYLMTQSVGKLLRVDPGLQVKGLYRVFYDGAEFRNQPAYDLQGEIERGVPRSQALKENWRAVVERHFEFQQHALEQLHAVRGVESAAVNSGAGLANYEVEGTAGPVMMLLLDALGGLGLVLSALGVYAVMAYAVSRRTHEIGIRMAVGARREQIQYLFLRQGARLTPNGLLLGIIVAITAGHYSESLLFGVAPADPWVFAAVLLTLGYAGASACGLPARRAAQIDPMVALRCE